MTLEPMKTTQTKTKHLLQMKRKDPDYTENPLLRKRKSENKVKS